MALDKADLVLHEGVVAGDEGDRAAVVAAQRGVDAGLFRARRDRHHGVDHAVAAEAR